MGGFLVASVSFLDAVSATSTVTTWYAYPAGTSSSTTNCPETATTSSECSLTLALSNAKAGDTVALATSGVEGTTSTYYIGNFTVSTGISPNPLTIEPAMGVTDPILDGNLGSSIACPTTTCDGPVLRIGSGATIEGITIQHGYNTIVTDPITRRGGGIYNGGTATLTDDTFSGDSATQYGGGVYSGVGSATILIDDTFSGDSAEYGGGAYINGPATATLTDDTLSGNSATQYGGGVFNEGTATLTNDTLSGNSATGVPATGGGIYNDHTATLTNDTLSGDSATYGGGIYNNNTASISNSILNAAPCQGSSADGGYNVESDNTCDFVTHDIVNSSTIHLASSLAANGSTGPETLAIGTDSSAYEEVPSAECTPALDERDDPRPGFPGKNCDAGAFEYQQPTPTTPTISNLPGSGIYGGGFTATVSTNGDGTQSVTSNSTGVCAASGLAVSYVGVGTCSLTAHVAAGTDYTAADGTAQTFSVGKATPSTTSIFNLPGSGIYDGRFTATVSTNGDGTRSVTSNSKGVCTASGRVVSYVGVGTCSLTAHVAAGTDYTAAHGSPQTFPVGKATTKTALKLSTTKVTYGHEQTEHLSVTVSPQHSGSKPTGTVKVKESSTTLCVITLSSGKGSCTLSAKRLKVGTYRLVATYGGSTNFKGSTSAKETLTVVK
jgi:hypothetical protein